jgi:succinyl-diaminopimelate desuccinylase
MTTPLKSDWYRFAEKARLALETSLENDPTGGTSGLEVEFNILDESLSPVARVGYGPESRSFADYLHDERLPTWARDRFQLEVFHWMTEIATRPFYSPYATAAEAWLLEGVLLNTLADLRLSFGERFLALHGNIPLPVEVTRESIPEGWNLARKRYLRRCVGLFGDRLATAGIHTNHSFPEALLSWDFVHLPLKQRQEITLEDFRNQALIRATRLLRPFCPVFIAVSAASPLVWEEIEGEPRPVLTGVDSQRVLAFPNPDNLDVPGLYASHEDYLRISYDLVRRGIRFGANNWTSVRARSGVDPVNRNIMATSEQLRELYRRGIFAAGDTGSMEDAEAALVIENLCARVDLPMTRVEVRTDEGGDDFDLSVAKLVLKDLLMLRIYADPQYGADYRYNADDVARSRRGEHEAARRGLDAQIEHPYSHRDIGVRDLLAELLTEVGPLAESLDLTEALEPMVEMARGGPNPASSARQWFRDRLGTPQLSHAGNPVIPDELLRDWCSERARVVAREVRRIVADDTLGEPERGRLRSLTSNLEKMALNQPAMPVRLAGEVEPLRVTGVSDRCAEVVELAGDLIRIPSVTNCPSERLEDVATCGRFIAGLLQKDGCEVKLYDQGRYPAVLAGFPGQLTAPVTLCGHFDVVEPDPDDGQFVPRVDGDYLWGRGAADMKTVVASYLVWMRHVVRAGSPHPPFNLLLVGNEENGEGEAFGTPHVLQDVGKESGWQPELMVVGERTGEEGDELTGAVCTSNRGVVRIKVRARGRRGHTGTGAIPGDLVDRLIEVRSVLGSVFSRFLTQSSYDGWESTARFPFLDVGTDGVYNITAGAGVLGIEVRPIPDDDVYAMVEEMGTICGELGHEVEVETMEAGITCPRDNRHLQTLLEAVEEVSGEPVELGRKKPASSARFAPGGNAVVWGQTGIGPHAPEERHFIPSIEPYLKALDVFAHKTLNK